MFSKVKWYLRNNFRSHNDLIDHLCIFDDKSNKTLYIYIYRNTPFISTSLLHTNNIWIWITTSMLLVMSATTASTIGASTWSGCLCFEWYLLLNVNWLWSNDLIVNWYFFLLFLPMYLWLVVNANIFEIYTSWGLL